MDERRAADHDVLGSLPELVDDEPDTVVATVVDVEGSAYRRPGAKMLVDADGSVRGQITAGCLEDEVRTIATDVLAAEEPRLETYDLADGDAWGLGIGCNGIVDVLVEPLGASYAPLSDAVESGVPVGVVTVLDGDDHVPLGARAYYQDGTVERLDDSVPKWMLDPIHGPLQRLVERNAAETISLDTDEGAATVFVDGIRPAPRLVILGTGHDVGPVVELGKRNGFRVEVVGFRGAVSLKDRFPESDECVSTSPADVAEAVAPDENTYAVVMTHNFVDDRLAVGSLIGSNLPYVGVMGPRERFERMLEAFEAEGRAFEPGSLDAVYAPIGIDLGSGSPSGIATSVVAEVLAVHNERNPDHLRNVSGPIHDRVGIDCGRENVESDR